MKFKFLRDLTTFLTVTTISTVTNFSLAQAQTFGQQRLDSGNVVAMAVPFANNQYRLVVIEQQTNEKNCWSERGSNPVIIDPLLLEFDFTGICGRATDSNGYSIRLGSRDLGWTYALRIVQRNNELLLVGKPVDGSKPELIIGRTNGLGNGSKKIILEPGWRFSKRTYNGNVLGHYYLATNNSPLRNPTPSRPSPSSPSPSPQDLSDGKTPLHDFVDLLCENYNNLPGCTR
jgi:hypothetical protein